MIFWLISLLTDSWWNAENMLGLCHLLFCLDSFMLVSCLSFVGSRQTIKGSQALSLSQQSFLVTCLVHWSRRPFWVGCFEWDLVFVFIFIPPLYFRHSWSFRVLCSIVSFLTVRVVLSNEGVMVSFSVPFIACELGCLCCLVFSIMELCTYQACLARQGHTQRIFF